MLVWWRHVAQTGNLRCFRFGDINCIPKPHPRANFILDCSVDSLVVVESDRNTKCPDDQSSLNSCLRVEQENGTQFYEVVGCAQTHYWPAAATGVITKQYTSGMCYPGSMIAFRWKRTWHPLNPLSLSTCGNGTANIYSCKSLPNPETAAGLPQEPVSPASESPQLSSCTLTNEYATNTCLFNSHSSITGAWWMDWSCTPAFNVYNNTYENNELKELEFSKATVCPHSTSTETHRTNCSGSGEIMHTIPSHGLLLSTYEYMCLGTPVSGKWISTGCHSYNDSYVLVSCTQTEDGTIARVENCNKDCQACNHSAPEWTVGHCNYEAGAFSQVSACSDPVPEFIETAVEGALWGVAAMIFVVAVSFIIVGAMVFASLYKTSFEYTKLP
ncbi:hypothetical protein Pelo_15342 [Pelomyxa schiedti]|nr:hypothetical protein Pelo_15342 [Pelomyxa schiedti]